MLLYLPLKDTRATFTYELQKVGYLYFNIFALNFQEEGMILSMTYYEIISHTPGEPEKRLIIGRFCDTAPLSEFQLHYVRLIDRLKHPEKYTYKNLAEEIKTEKQWLREHLNGIDELSIDRQNELLLILFSRAHARAHARQVRFCQVLNA